MNQEREFVLVACRGDDVMGYVHAEDHRMLFAPVMVNVLGIAVISAVRGQGTGRLLMDGVERWARTRGALAVRLVSVEQRSGVHVLHARLGCVSSKRQLNFRKQIGH